MAKLSLCSVNPEIFQVSASQTADGTQRRADLVAAGRTLAYDFATRGQNAIHRALQSGEADATARLNRDQYTDMNRKFQEGHLLYAAKLCAAASGETAPEDFEGFKRVCLTYFKNPNFIRVLEGVYREILTPILPEVYSEAVSVFADTVEVGFGETYSLTVDSNDICLFQDSAWGSSRSVPANRFYTKDFTLNPTPRTCEIRLKWVQMVANGMDYGRYFANIVAGLYSYTTALWNKMLTAAASDTSLVPSALTGTFNQVNWVTLANKLAAVNRTSISNLFATGNAVALSKVLPTQVTGSTNVNMDAAIATLLGADFTRSGYLGEYMSVRLLPLMDAIVPGTQNTTVTTILPNDTVWMLAGNGRKPLTIAINRDTPIEIEITPERTTSMEYIFNITTALDAAAVFSSKLGIMTV